MKRRSFLQLLGLAPIAPAIAKLPQPTPLPVFNPGPNFSNQVPDGFKPLFTYTGNGSSDRTIFHGMNFKPDMVLIKRSTGWEVIK